MTLAEEVLAAVVGALVTLTLGLASGRTHGWSVVVVVVIGAILGPSILAAVHGRE